MGATQGVVIKVGLAGAAAARREANATGKSVKGMGGDAEKAGRKFKLAEASMHGFEKTSHRLRHVVRELAGVTGLAGLAFGTAEMVKSAISAEAAQAKLTATLKSSGISYRRYGKEIDEALDKQAQFAGFTKADVSDSLGNFIRTTGSVRKSLKLNNIAFDLAHTKGIGLANAQSILARAYNGNYKGLTRLGVAITPVTVAQDKLKVSGHKYTVAQLARAKADDKAATATQALSIIQRKFGGQTAAYGKTAVGQRRPRPDLARDRAGADRQGPPPVRRAGRAEGRGTRAGVREGLAEDLGDDQDRRRQGQGGAQPAAQLHRPASEGREKPRGRVRRDRAEPAGDQEGRPSYGSQQGGRCRRDSPLGRAVGFATKADGSVKRPFYVVVLDKAPTGTRRKITDVAKKAAPWAAAAAQAGAGASLLEWAGLLAATAAPFSLIAALALTNNHNYRTRGRGASSASNPAGHVGFDPGALSRRITTPVNPMAVSPAQASPAGAAILNGGGGPFVIHNKLIVDGRVLAEAVTRSAKKKQALK